MSASALELNDKQLGQIERAESSRAEPSLETKLHRVNLDASKRLTYLTFADFLFSLLMLSLFLSIVRPRIISLLKQIKINSLSKLLENTNVKKLRIIWSS